MLCGLRRGSSPVPSGSRSCTASKLAGPWAQLSQMWLESQERARPWWEAASGTLRRCGGGRANRPPPPGALPGRQRVWGRMGASVSVFLLQEEEFPSLLEGLGLPSVGCGLCGCGRRCCGLPADFQETAGCLPGGGGEGSGAGVIAAAFPLVRCPEWEGGLGSEEVGFRRMAPGPPRALLVPAPGPTQPGLQDRAVSGPG